MAAPTDPERLAQYLVAQATPEQQRALLDTLLGVGVPSFFEPQMAEPTLRPIPTDVRGFRVRLDLSDTKPPVWRRLELRGDEKLPRLHDVIQAAMGWTDSHLHRFRTDGDYRSPSFVTTVDLDEGEDGVLEDPVRLDQLVAAEGDKLWYEYDFGDGWDHVLTVEKVLDEPPERARCTGGRMACPPEDCGGPGGYQDLAAWARSGYDESLLPDNVDDAAHAHDWLSSDWHPDHFDVGGADTAVSAVAAEPVAVTGELADLLGQLERRGIRALRDVLARPLAHGPTEVIDAEAARLTETYKVFLDVIGDGVTLTAAGYLPPSVVERFAELSGISGWWIGRANREDLTPPVSGVRDTARALGLVTVRKGRLAPTAAGTRCRRDPKALWQHIVGRLPIGTKALERDSGWLALAVAGSGIATEDWRDEISDLLYALGWRTAHDQYSRPSAYSATLVVLEELAGAARTGSRVTGTDLAVATTARAAIRRH